MRSGTSYFNRTLLGKNLARFWPIWSLYALIWVVLIPVSILSQRPYWDADSARALPLRLIGGESPALLLCFLFGILAAMAVFSYLYTARSVGMLHALPMRREGLFLTNYLSGLAFLIVPNLAVFLLGLAAEALNGTVVFSSLFTWLVVTSLMGLFFYSFAVFCAMFTGHVLALPAFYLILSFLAPGLIYLLEFIAREFLFGFTGAAWAEGLATWLSPFLSMLTGTDSGNHFPSNVYQFHGLGLVTLYALIGLGLAVAALVLYRRRHLERAGDVVTVGWMRPVFRYGVALCAAITLGSFFHSLFQSLFYSILPRSPWLLLGWMLLWGAAGYFIAEMLLNKRFWVFKTGWKGCVAFLVCLCAGMGALELDLMGFERAVPDTARIQSVQLFSVDTAPRDSGSRPLSTSDPEVIAQVVDLHADIVSQKKALEEWQTQDTGSSWTTCPDGISVEEYFSNSILFSYTLTDGSVMERRYQVPITADGLKDPASLSGKLSALVNRTDLVYDNYFGDVGADDQLVSISIVNLYDPEHGNYGFEYLPAELLEPLMEAIRTDIAEGNLGRRYLLEDRERMDNCCYADLELTYRAPLSSDHSPAVPSTQSGSELTPSDENGIYSFTITLQRSAVHTMEVLKDYPNAFLSQSDIQKLPQD